MEFRRWRQLPFGGIIEGEIHHEPSDDHPGGNAFMERFDHIYIFFKGIAADIHRFYRLFRLKAVSFCNLQTDRLQSISPYSFSIFTAQALYSAVYVSGL